MVSTRHHPKAFPEPDLSPSRTPSKSTTSSSSPSTDSSSPNGYIAIKSPGKKTAVSKTRGTTAGAAASSTITTMIPFAAPITPRGNVHNPPPLLILWLIISLPLVIWDTLYIFLRPYSMPGGSLHSPIWKPYDLYGRVDHIYGWPAWDNGVGFTAAQASLNTVETVAYLWYFYKVVGGVQGVKGGVAAKTAALLKGSHTGAKDCAEAVTVAYAVSVMTISKTVLYWLNEYFSNFDNIGHNDAFSLFWLWIVPNGAWLVLPSYMAWVFGRDIVAGLKRAEGKMK